MEQKMMIKLILTLLFCFICLTGRTETTQYVVTGSGVESKAGEALPYANNAFGAGNVGWFRIDIGDNTSEIIAPTSFTMSNFKAYVREDPGVGKINNFTIRKNEVATDLSVTIVDTNHFSSIDTDEITFSAGDGFDITNYNDGIRDGKDYGWYYTITPDIDDEVIICGGTSYNFTIAADRYFPAWGAKAGEVADQTEIRSVFPVAGTIKKLYAESFDDPGTAGDTWDVTININGTPSDVTCQIDDVAPFTANDTVHTDTVAAGDIVTIHWDETGSCATAQVAWGFVFVPDDSGKSILISTSDNQADNTKTEYAQVACGDTAWLAEVAVPTLSPKMTATAMYVNQSVAPGTDKSWTYTLRDDGEDTALSCTISNGETTCNDTGSVDIAEGSILTYSATATNTPALTFVGLGLAIETTEEEAPTRRIILIQY